MPVTLPPEILARIAHFIKKPRVPHLDLDSDDDGVEDRVVGEMATLQAVMRTSKVYILLSITRVVIADALQALHIAGEIETYKDCIVGNTDSFLESVRPGPPFDRIERLQLFTRTSPYELDYLHVLRDGRWDDMYVKMDFNQDPDWRHAWDLGLCADRIVVIGGRLRALLIEGVEVLPNLKNVSLGGFGDHQWNDWEIADRLGICPLSVIEHVTAQTLLDLPALENLCQYHIQGPLALCQAIIKPDSPIRVYTHHPRPYFPLPPLIYEMPPPIIIGAINRYYANVCHDVCIGRDPPELELAIMKGALLPLVPMLAPSRNQVLHTTRRGKATASASLEDTDLSGTIIEFYDYVRAVDGLEVKLAACGCCTTAADKPPLPLDKVQSLLEMHIHPKWRGRVFLKNREDAPPCPSCGLNPQAEHEHLVKAARDRNAGQ